MEGVQVCHPHHSNHCYAAILIGKILVRQTPHASNNPTSSIPFLSTVIASSLHNRKLKLNACSVPRSELTVQFSYSLPFKMVAHITEVCRNMQKLPIDDVTCTPSIYLLDIHKILALAGQ